MARLVDDLLLVTELDPRGTGEPVASPPMPLEQVDVAHVAAEVAWTVGSARPTREITLDLPEHALAHASHERLGQVLRHLLDNATRYSEPGHAGRRGRSTADDDVVRVAVTDHGRGIPSGEHERIFEPFIRLEDPLRMTTSGVGLGLYIARRLAREMGGDVIVSVTPGAGVDLHPGIGRNGRGADRRTAVGNDRTNHRNGMSVRRAHERLSSIATPEIPTRGPCADGGNDRRAQAGTRQGTCAGPRGEGVPGRPREGVQARPQDDPREARGTHRGDQDRHRRRRRPGQAGRADPTAHGRRRTARISSRTNRTWTRSRTRFVDAAAEYSERKGITYSAWRELGVPAAVLKRAGVKRDAPDQLRPSRRGVKRTRRTQLKVRADGPVHVPSSLDDNRCRG